MNRLVQELIKNLLPEEEKKQTTALYAGGFKPPTAGHFAVVQEALKQNPEIDELIIFIGAKERDGVTQDESFIIWKIYSKYLPFKVKLQPSSLPPIKAVYDFAKNHPTREVLWVLGAREDNEEDFKDLANRTKSITNYPNIEVRTIITKGGVSGTAARNASKVSFEKFEPFIPSVLTPEEKQEVYQITSGKMQENLDQPFDKTIIYPDFQGSDIADNVNGEVKTLKVSDCIGNEPGKDFNYFNTERKSYVEKMIKSAEKKGIESFPPIVAIKHPSLPGKYLVLDGNHRLGAFKIGNIPEIKAIVLSEDDIYLATPETEYEEGVIPETISLKDAKSEGIDLKKYFNTKDLNIPKTTLNENASYSQYIDIKQKIKEYTQHMLQKGMNIVPLPKVIFEKEQKQKLFLIDIDGTICDDIRNEESESLGTSLRCGRLDAHALDRALDLAETTSQLVGVEAVGQGERGLLDLSQPRFEGCELGVHLGLLRLARRRLRRPVRRRRVQFEALHRELVRLLAALRPELPRRPATQHGDSSEPQRKERVVACALRELAQLARRGRGRGLDLMRHHRSRDSEESCVVGDLRDDLFRGWWYWDGVHAVPPGTPWRRRCGLDSPASADGDVAVS